MAVFQIPTDQAGDEKEQSAEPDGEDALILPAWTSGPLMAVRPDPGDEDSEYQPDQGDRLDVHA